MDEGIEQSPVSSERYCINNHLGISPSAISTSACTLRKRRPPLAGLFIKGPLPLDWLQQANQIGGSTGIVAAALWFYVGLTCSNRFKVDGRLDSLCGLTRQTRDLALRKLQDAGLLRLSSRRGSYPTVEIVTTVRKGSRVDLASTA